MEYTKLIKEYTEKIQKENTYKDINTLFKRYYNLINKSDKIRFDEITDITFKRWKEVLINFLSNNNYYENMKLKDIETGKIGILEIKQCFQFYPVIKWLKKDGTVSEKSYANYKRISKSYNEKRILYALNNYYEKI